MTRDCLEVIGRIHPVLELPPLPRTFYRLRTASFQGNNIDRGYISRCPWLPELSRSQVLPEHPLHRLLDLPFLPSQSPGANSVAYGRVFLGTILRLSQLPVGQIPSSVWDLKSLSKWVIADLIGPKPN